MASDNNIPAKAIVRLQKFFKFGFSNTAHRVVNRIFPLDVKKDTVNKKITLDQQVFPEEVQALFNYWMTNCHDAGESWKNRQQLYEDCDMMYYNCGIMSRAIETVADESIQADTNQQPIMVEAAPDVRKFIFDFFDKVGIYNYIRPTIIDFVQYGDAGWLLSFDETGVNEIIPIAVYDLQDRLEFTPYEINYKMKKQDSLFVQFKKMDRVAQLIDSIKDKENISTYFKKYLFGFQIADKVVPPWRFIHFRNLTTKSPFKPFGVPVFIHSISPYRQLDAGMTLQVIARGMKFPKNIYELNIPNVVMPTEKLNMAIDFMNQIKNSGLHTSKNELPGIGETIVTIKDLYEFKQETPEINLDKIDDLNMLRKDVVISTMLPPSLLDPDDSGFGHDGNSLVQEYKPFARLVYRQQSTFLQGLTQLIKIHMIASNKFPSGDIDFILSMPYPESQVNAEIIQSQNSLLDLTNNIINAIQDKIMGGNVLPPELIKDIYQQILPYDDDRISRWINKALNFKSEEELKNQQQQQPGEFENPSQEENFKLEDRYLKQYINRLKGEYSKSRRLWEQLEREVGKKELQESVQDIIFKCKQDILREGVVGSRHYYSSRNRSVDFEPELLREFDKARIKKMSESVNGKLDDDYYKEEVEYKFGKEKNEE